MKKSRKVRLKDAIQKEVIENDDFQRMILETADGMNLPPDVVKGVVENFCMQLPNFIYPRNKTKRISVFGFFNINVKKIQKKTI